MEQPNNRNPKDTGDKEPGYPPFAEGNIFGFPFNEENSKIVILPVPWEATVSYGGGTSKGPELIRNASHQLDFMDPFWGEPWKSGIYMPPQDNSVLKEGQRINKIVQNTRESGGKADTEELKAANHGCEAFIQTLKKQCHHWLDQGKITALVGGEHTVSMGLISALAERKQSFGILQIDAHADLRKNYENLTCSHASVMYNALQLQAVKSITSVGVRDYSPEENRFMQKESGSIKPFLMEKLHHRLFNGETWDHICSEIISSLPQHVYITFDIDALEPWLCPGTGTPVPGGLTFQQAVHLLRKVADSGKTIIGFDLVETAPSEGEWDGNVGARMLYKLCAAALRGHEH